MKRLIIPFLGIATFVSAQNELPVTPEPLPPPSPNDVVNPVPPVPPTPPLQVGPGGGANVNRSKTIRRSGTGMAGQGGNGVVIEIQTQQAQQALAEAQAVVDRMNAGAVRRERIELELPRTTKTGRTLVVQVSEPDPVAMAELEEDLSVMALILRKATGGSMGDEKRMALGIEVDSSVFGSSSGARNLYVEGHGAMFLLAVPFPLIAPPEKSTQTKVKSKPDSDWAEAREELLKAERSRLEVQLERIWSGNGKPGAADYDAAKVEALTLDMLRALKNATHIRGLKPDEFVTVVIQGEESIRGDKWTVANKAGKTSSKSDSRRGETVMTIRVKRSDIDAFDSGKLELAAFRKKASIQTYFRRGDSSVGTATFLGPNP